MSAEAIERLLRWRGEIYEPCPSCLAEFGDDYEYAGHEVDLGKGRYTVTDCVTKDLLVQR